MTISERREDIVNRRNQAINAAFAELVALEKECPHERTTSWHESREIPGMVIVGCGGILRSYCLDCCKQLS